MEGHDPQCYEEEVGLLDQGNGMVVVLYYQSDLEGDQKMVEVGPWVQRS